MNDITTTHFCKECGTRMEGEYAFCPECGTSLNAVEAIESAAAAEQSPIDPSIAQQQQPARPANPLSKKAKILIASGAFLIALVVGAYFLGNYLTDEQRLLDRFDKAVEQGKADKLFSLMASSNEEIKFNQKTAEGIVQYLGSNREYFDTIKRQLASEAKQLKSGEAASFESDDNAAFVYLHKKDKKRWLIYDDYELKVKRYMIPVQTNYEGAQIWVDEDKSATASEAGATIEIGPFLPGEYEIKSVYEGEYTTLENKEKVALFPMTGYHDAIDLELQGDYVNVYSNNANAHIVINGKDIGLTVGDGQQIGPIAIDGSSLMYVEAEYPWGKMQSEELSVDSDQLDFNLSGLNDAVKDDIMNSTHDFVASWIEGFQTRDVSVMRHIHPDRVTDFSEYFTNMTDTGEYYKGSLDKMTFDLDSFSVDSYSEGVYTATVKVQVEYQEVFYYDSDIEEPAPSPGTNYTQYELQYTDGQWLVSNWTTSYDVGTANTKVFE